MSNFEKCCVSMLMTLHDAVKEELGDAPESSFYVAFGMDIELFNGVKATCIQAGWVKPGVLPHTLAITDLGMEKAVEVEKIMAQGRAEREAQSNAQSNALNN